MNVWFTSDSHFGHENMILKGWRPQFENVWEMDQTIIQNWNSVVRPKDQVWHLGDFATGVSDDYIADVVNQLHGNIHFIAGNHDACWPGHRNSHKVQREWLEMGFASVQAFARRKVGDEQVLLSHFPYVGDHTEGDRFDEYRLADKGYWLLHGHVHDVWVVRNRMVNVGVDVNGFRPISIDTISDIISDDLVADALRGLS